MNLLLWMSSSIVALFTISSLIHCSPLSELLWKTTRFRAMTAAIEHLNECPPASMPLEEKCKRYAILLSVATSAGVPYESNAYKLLTIDDDSLNQQYKTISIKHL